MRVLFSVPRYHPNHDGMVAGLLDAGHSVAFAVHRTHPTEKYADGVAVHVVERALISRLLPWAENDKRHFSWSFPSLGSLRHIFGTIRPDVVVARDLWLTNYVLFLICRARGVSFFLYVQSRLGYEPMRRRDRVLLRLGLWPRHTMSTTERQPAMQIPGKTFDFIPFAIEPYDYRKEHYPTTLPIRILAIGKFNAPNKHNAELVRTLAPHLRAGRARLTIIGLRDQLVTPVYQRLLDTIAAEGVGQAVTLHSDLSYDATRRMHCEHDLFILASTRESAGIAPIEAMATGLAVITSSDSGTKYFVEPGETGFIFEDKNFEDLNAKVKYFIKNISEIERMGRRGRQVILETYSPKDFARRFAEPVLRYFPERTAALPAAAEPGHAMAASRPSGDAFPDVPSPL